MVVRIELSKCLDPTELIWEEAAAMRDADVKIGNGIERATEDPVGRGHRRLIGEFEHWAVEPRSWSAHEPERHGLAEKGQARLPQPGIPWTQVLVLQSAPGYRVSYNRGRPAHP